ncbi:MAG TPA: alpha/beta hydrolase [Burkholderiales bacterium]|nr:alpha/beta hydrolase [Burkholderiales bacterium]
MKDSKSNLLDTVEIETAPYPEASVIWLHGLGADGNDFAPIVPELGFSKSPAVRFVFPHAPERPVTINHGYVMRAWYDITFDDLAGKSRGDEAGIRASQTQIEALIAREQARGIAADRIVMAGFSQGGAIALHSGPRHPQRLAGILALSAYLPLKDRVAAEAAPANYTIPILMAHGSFDDVVPLPLAIASRDALAALGHRVDWREYPMAHTVCGQEIAEIGKWLRNIFGAQAGR